MVSPHAHHTDVSRKPAESGAPSLAGRSAVRTRNLKRSRSRHLNGHLERQVVKS